MRDGAVSFVLEVDPAEVLEKGRLAPGKMFLVDTERGRVIKDNEIKAAISRRRPYRHWLEKNRIQLKGLLGAPHPGPAQGRETGSTGIAGAVQRPDAAFYLWPRTPITDTDFARGLFDQQHVTVLPGSYLSRDTAHGNPGSNQVRIALVAPLDECVEAARRIRAFVEQL